MLIAKGNIKRGHNLNPTGEKNPGSNYLAFLAHGPRFDIGFFGRFCPKGRLSSFLLPEPIQGPKKTDDEACHCHEKSQTEVNKYGIKDTVLGLKVKTRLCGCVKPRPGSLRPRGQVHAT